MTAEGQEGLVIQSAPPQVAEATAPAEPARTESPPKPAIGEPLAPLPAKPVATQDEQAAAPLQLAEIESSAPAPEEVAAAPEETTEPASPEVPQLAAAERLALVTDEAAAETSAVPTEEGLPEFAEAGVFSPFPLEDAPPAAQAPPSTTAEGPTPAPSSDLSAPALTETPQLASLPGPRAAGLQSADAAFDLNDCQLATQLYTQALEQGGLSSRGQAEAYNNRGRCHLDDRSFEEAIADFNSAIDMQPNYAAAFFNRGRAYQAVGEAALAQSDMKRAYELGFKRLGLSPATP
jgi:tetratricopeptide (TPR) repeat protein